MNFTKWVQEYETSYQGDSIEYRDSSGSWQDDPSPRFTSIAPALQSRGYISRPQLRRIGRWKAQSGRIDRWLKSNSQQEVEIHTAAAFNASKEKTAIEELTELDGVGVPVASAILTMFDPTKYAIIDYRALRALAFIQPQLADPQNYPQYVEFMDHFRSYNSQADAYEFFITEVQQISSNQNLDPREVDMALWSFDESV